MRVGIALLKAALMREKAKEATAQSNLLAIIENPVGIGEHTLFDEEIDRHVSSIADARDRIEVIEGILEEYDP
jgi:hypothetical protein